MIQETIAQENAPVTEMELQYLLKELEIQFNIEARARDRAEQMVQYLLTSIAAIIGAVLFLLPSMDNPIPVVFVAVLLMYVFGVSSFYRTCRLRNIITHTRLTRRLIRDALYHGNVKQARLLAETEESPTGFSERIVRSILGIAVLCSFFGAAFFALAGSLLFQRTLMVSIAAAVLGIIGFAITLAALLLILRNYRRIAGTLQETYSLDRHQDQAMA